MVTKRMLFGVLLLSLACSLCAAQVMDRHQGKIRALKNQDGGYVYLIPGQSQKCAPGFGDAYAEDLVGEQTLHGCYQTLDHDVIILTDDKRGFSIPEELFVPIEEA